MSWLEETAESVNKVETRASQPDVIIRGSRFAALTGVVMTG